MPPEWWAIAGRVANAPKAGATLRRPFVSEDLEHFDIAFDIFLRCTHVHIIVRAQCSHIRLPEIRPTLQSSSGSQELAAQIDCYIHRRTYNRIFG